LAKESTRAGDHKLKIEMNKICSENHDRILKLEYTNRKNEIEMIHPADDLKILRYKNKELENSRGAQPNLKQNFDQHVQTLYNNEAKYLGERAELYRSNVYNPYLLKAYVDSLKNESKISSTFTNGSGYPSQNNVVVDEQENEKEPKFFADKVFSNFKKINRDPLEQQLSVPNNLCSQKVQENGLVLKQSTYGKSYNTKKYLQENKYVELKRTGEPIYKPLTESELEYQDIALKSNNDLLSLNDNKNGLSSSQNHLIKFQDRSTHKIEKNDKPYYPRMVGPIPHPPYEAIYCNKEVSEMSDGFFNRFYNRVYDSPYLKNLEHQYVALETDLNAMENYADKVNAERKQNEQLLNKLNEQTLKDEGKILITNSDLKTDRSRRTLDSMSIKLRDQHKISTYSSTYLPYEFKKQETCPQNEIFNEVAYADSVEKNDLPYNLTSLQDKWNKTLAMKRFKSAYTTKCPDLRENVQSGKKLIKDSPMVAPKYANIEI
jgi:hypothetical protein